MILRIAETKNYNLALECYTRQLIYNSVTSGILDLSGFNCSGAVCRYKPQPKVPIHQGLKTAEFCSLAQFILKTSLFVRAE